MEPEPHSCALAAFSLPATGAQQPAEELAAPLPVPSECGPLPTGNDRCVSYGQLAARDQGLLSGLYRRLTELYQVVGDPSTDDAQKWRKLARWTDPRALNALIDEVTELGDASRDGLPTKPMVKAMHDVRGGALTALLGHFQLARFLPHNEEETRIILTLARDHLEIMRATISGLAERAQVTPAV